MLPFKLFVSPTLVPYCKDISGCLSVHAFLVPYLSCFCSEQMYADATVVGTFERNGYCVTADCKLNVWLLTCC